MTVPQASSETAVLGEIRTILAEVLDLSDVDDIEITAEMSLIDDLGLESIDLVSIGSMLTERYGEQVNLASFLADQEMDDVIKLTVGGLVDFVASRLSNDQA
ncbi:MAG TPA: phosphopantetheine-binding protein [Pseudonocardiaceae bacterium]|jgi:acyl carrier protein|nr:phosphopantetheine-binding protein [Pseudonocardiaceae bacterium]